MPITPRLRERLAAVLGEPLECLECERPIEPECPSSILCWDCLFDWHVKRYPDQPLPPQFGKQGVE